MAAFDLEGEVKSFVLYAATSSSPRESHPAPPPPPPGSTAEMLTIFLLYLS